GVSGLYVGGTGWHPPLRHPPCRRTVVGPGHGVPVIGGDAALSCSPYGNSNIESKPFNWTKEETDSRKLVFLHNTGSNDRIGQDEEFQGRVSHFSDKLTQGQAYITIKNVKLTDNGKYTCNFPDRTTEILLHVGECCHETFDYSVLDGDICG
uniref:Ig-like domain-containing protein n=1 Tax=Neolamprologus brichardi TaxID=32507 RepID=A0A3Q4MF86_NEOBR